MNNRNTSKTHHEDGKLSPLAMKNVEDVTNTMNKIGKSKMDRPKPDEPTVKLDYRVARNRVLPEAPVPDYQIAQRSHQRLAEENAMLNRANSGLNSRNRGYKGGYSLNGAKKQDKQQLGLVKAAQKDAVKERNLTYKVPSFKKQATSVARPLIKNPLGLLVCKPKNKPGVQPAYDSDSDSDSEDESPFAYQRSQYGVLDVVFDDVPEPYVEKPKAFKKFLVDAPTVTQERNVKSSPKKVSQKEELIVLPEIGSKKSRKEAFKKLMAEAQQELFEDELCFADDEYELTPEGELVLMEDKDLFTFATMTEVNETELDRITVAEPVTVKLAEKAVVEVRSETEVAKMSNTIETITGPTEPLTTKLTEQTYLDVVIRDKFTSGVAPVVTVPSVEPMEVRSETELAKMSTTVETKTGPTKPLTTQKLTTVLDDTPYNNCLKTYQGMTNRILAENSHDPMCDAMIVMRRYALFDLVVLQRFLNDRPAAAWHMENLIDFERFHCDLYPGMSVHEMIFQMQEAKVLEWTMAKLFSRASEVVPEAVIELKEAPQPLPPKKVLADRKDQKKPKGKAPVAKPVKKLTPDEYYELNMKKYLEEKSLTCQCKLQNPEKDVFKAKFGMYPRKCEHVIKMLAKKQAKKEKYLAALTAKGRKIPEALLSKDKKTVEQPKVVKPQPVKTTKDSFRPEVMKSGKPKKETAAKALKETIVVAPEEPKSPKVNKATQMATTFLELETQEIADVPCAQATVVESAPIVTSDKVQTYSADIRRPVVFTPLALAFAKGAESQTALEFGSIEPKHFSCGTQTVVSTAEASTFTEDEYLGHPIYAPPPAFQDIAMNWAETVVKQETEVQKPLKPVPKKLGTEGERIRLVATRGKRVNVTIGEVKVPSIAEIQAEEEAKAIAQASKSPYSEFMAPKKAAKPEKAIAFTTFDRSTVENYVNKPAVATSVKRVKTRKEICPAENLKKLEERASNVLRFDTDVYQNVAVQTTLVQEEVKNLVTQSLEFDKHIPENYLKLFSLTPRTETIMDSYTSHSEDYFRVSVHDQYTSFKARSNHLIFDGLPHMFVAAMNVAEQVSADDKLAPHFLSWEDNLTLSTVMSPFDEYNGSESCWLDCLTTHYKNNRHHPEHFGTRTMTRNATEECFSDLLACSFNIKTDPQEAFDLAMEWMEKKPNFNASVVHEIKANKRSRIVAPVNYITTTARRNAFKASYKPGTLATRLSQRLAACSINYAPAQIRALAALQFCTDDADAIEIVVRRTCDEALLAEFYESCMDILRDYLIEVRSHISLVHRCHQMLFFDKCHLHDVDKLAGKSPFIYFAKWYLDSELSKFPSTNELPTLLKMSEGLEHDAQFASLLDVAPNTRGLLDFISYFKPAVVQKAEKAADTISDIGESVAEVKQEVSTAAKSVTDLADNANEVVGTFKALLEKVSNTSIFKRFGDFAKVFKPSTLINIFFSVVAMLRAGDLTTVVLELTRIIGTLIADTSLLLGITAALKNWIASRQLHEKQEPVDEATPKAMALGAEDFTAYLPCVSGIVYIGGCALLLGKVATGTSISHFVEEFGKNGRSLANIEAGLKSLDHLQEWITGLVSSVVDRCFGVNPLYKQLKSIGGERLTVFIKMMDVVSTEPTEAKDNRRVRQFVMSFKKDVDDWQWLLRGDMPRGLKDTLNQKFRAYATLYKEMYDAESGCRSRFDPTAIWIAGKPRQGKSFVVADIGEFIQSDVLKEPTGAFIRNAAEEYWSSYQGQYVAAFDDIGQAKQIMVEAEFMNVRTNNTYNIPQAAVEKKGDFFRSFFVLCTSNHCAYIPSLDQVRDIDAFLERRHRVYWLAAKEEYQDGAGHIDPAKVLAEMKKDPLAKDLRPWACYYLRNPHNLSEDLSNSTCTEDKAMTFAEFACDIAIVHHKHRAAQFVSRKEYIDGYFWDPRFLGADKHDAFGLWYSMKKLPGMAQSNINIREAAAQIYLANNPGEAIRDFDFESNQYGELVEKFDIFEKKCAMPKTMAGSVADSEDEFMVTCTPEERKTAELEHEDDYSSITSGSDFEPPEIQEQFFKLDDEETASDAFSALAGLDYYMPAAPVDPAMLTVTDPYGTGVAYKHTLPRMSEGIIADHLCKPDEHLEQHRQLDFGALSTTRNVSNLVPKGLSYWDRDACKFFSKLHDSFNPENGTLDGFPIEFLDKVFRDPKYASKVLIEVKRQRIEAEKEGYLKPKCFYPDVEAGGTSDMERESICDSIREDFSSEGKHVVNCMFNEDHDYAVKWLIYPSEKRRELKAKVQRMMFFKKHDSFNDNKILAYAHAYYYTAKEGFSKWVADHPYLATGIAALGVLLMGFTAYKFLGRLFPSAEGGGLLSRIFQSCSMRYDTTARTVRAKIFKTMGNANSLSALDDGFEEIAVPGVEPSDSKWRNTMIFLKSYAKGFAAMFIMRSLWRAVLPDVNSATKNIATGILKEFSVRNGTGQRMAKYHTKGAGDDTAIDFIRRVKKNLRKIIFFGKTPQEDTMMNCLQISGTVILVPKHGLQLCTGYIAVHMGAHDWRKVEISHATVVGLRDRDAALINLKREIPACRDITKHFITCTDLSRLNQGNAYMVNLINQTRKIDAARDSDDEVIIREAYYELVGETVVSSPRGDIVYPKSFLMTAEVLAGDCGSFAVHRDSGVDHKLMGIVNFGNALKVGGVTPVLQEELRAALITLNNKEATNEFVEEELPLFDDTKVIGNLGSDPALTPKVMGILMNKADFDKLPMNSKVHKTPIFNMVKETKCEPAILHDGDRRSRRYFPERGAYLEACMKFTRRQMTHPIFKEKWFKDALVEFYKQIVPMEFRRPATYEESWNGNEQMTHFDRLALDTSPGYGLLKLKPKTCTEKGSKWLFNVDEETGKIVGEIPLLTERRKKMRESILDGKRFPMIWKASTKDEKRKIGKVPRIFSIADKSFTLECRKEYGCLTAGLMANAEDPRHPFGCGVDLDSNIAKHWLMAMKEKNNVGQDGDYAEFDASMLHDAMWLYNDIMEALVDSNPKVSALQKQESKRMRDGLMHEMVYSTQIMQDTIVANDHGNPSGNAITMPLNSATNFNYLFAIWCTVTPKEEHTVNRFLDHVFVKVQGDDNITVPDKQYADIFTLEACVNFFEPLGINMTSANKEKIAPLRPLSELTFLKRSFLETGTHVRAPIAKDVIFELTNWMKMGTNGTAQFEMNLETALEFAEAHGEEFFNAVKREVDSALVRIGKKATVSSYEYFHNRYLVKIGELSSSSLVVNDFRRPAVVPVWNFEEGDAEE